MNPMYERAAALGLSAAGTGILLLTALSQHPNRAFDRFRSLDKVGFAIPNWRFFAPEPAMSDFHLLHRTLGKDGRESGWSETHSVTTRKAIHVVWFPDRRIDKGLFDVASELVGLIDLGEEAVLSSPAYRVLRAFVRRKIELGPRDELEGFQFLLARSTGFDTSSVPQEILSSPFIPWGHDRER